MSKTSQENKLKKLSTAKSRNGGSEQKGVEVQNIEGQSPEIVEEQKAVVEENISDATPVTTKKTAKVRGKKYQKAKKLVDINKYYPLKEAVQLVKESSFSKFDGKIEAHVTVFDIGNVGDITFPHLETASKKVVVLNDAILAEIKDNKVNFDILIATPSTMPKLLPYARVLGPKGLMPNPKNGTLTEDTENAIKKLSVDKTTIKTEKKAPVVHMIVGKVSQPVEELIANIDELIKVIKPNKIKKLALCATMGPCVKVEITK